VQVWRKLHPHELLLQAPPDTQAESATINAEYDDDEPISDVCHGHARLKHDVQEATLLLEKGSKKSRCGLEWNFEP